MSSGAALCRNALRWDYSARDAIEDLELAIKAAEADRNKEPARTGRRACDIPRKW